MPGTIACLFELFNLTHSVADPGFPRRGRQPLGLTRKQIIFGENCRKIKELILFGGGGEHASLEPTLDDIKHRATLHSEGNW